jgi:hypothetical protein
VMFAPVPPESMDAVSPMRIQHHTNTVAAGTRRQKAPRSSQVTRLCRLRLTRESLQRDGAMLEAAQGGCVPCNTAPANCLGWNLWLIAAAVD